MSGIKNLWSRLQLPMPSRDQPPSTPRKRKHRDRTRRDVVAEVSETIKYERGDR
jgi:hypothetical protein